MVSDSLVSGSANVWLVINQASGSYDQLRLDGLLDKFASAGLAIKRTVNFPIEPLPSAAELDEEDIGQLAVFGGDGTVNAVLSSLAGWGGRLIILPGGTMNLLCRRLHGQSSAEAILDDVAAGEFETIRVSMMRCSGGNAYAGLMAGPATVWRDVREAMRKHDLATMAGGMVDAIGESISGIPVHVVEPPCGREGGYALIQITPAATGLVVDGYYAEGPGDIAAQGIAVLTRRFRDGPHDRLGVFDTLTLANSDLSPVSLLLDGEATPGEERERIQFAECDTNLIATAPQEIA